jgi:hypothetical protein
VDDLARLGAEPLDADQIEAMFTSKLDGGLAAITHGPVREQRTLTNDEVAAVLRSLYFARYRAPAWRRAYFAAMQQRNVERVERRLLPQLQNLDEGPLRKYGLTMRDIFDVQDDNAYALMIIQLVESDVLTRRGLGVAVLHAAGLQRFITCDNPCRPYLLDNLRGLQRGPLMGLLQGGIVATYPISPNACFLISKGLASGEHIAATDVEVQRINTALALIADDEVVLPGPSTDGLVEPWIRWSKLQAPLNP